MFNLFQIFVELNIPFHYVDKNINLYESEMSPTAADSIYRLLFANCKRQIRGNRNVTFDFHTYYVTYFY